MISCLTYFFGLLNRRTWCFEIIDNQQKLIIHRSQWVFVASKTNNRVDVILTLKSILVNARVCFMLYWPPNHAVLWQRHQLQHSLIWTMSSSHEGYFIHHELKGLVYRDDIWKPLIQSMEEELAITIVSASQVILWSISVKVFLSCHSLKRISWSIVHSVHTALSVNIPCSM